MRARVAAFARDARALGIVVAMLVASSWREAMRSDVLRASISFAMASIAMRAVRMCATRALRAVQGALVAVYVIETSAAREDVRAVAEREARDSMRRRARAEDGDDDVAVHTSPMIDGVTVRARADDGWLVWISCGSAARDDGTSTTNSTSNSSWFASFTDGVTRRESSQGSSMSHGALDCFTVRVLRGFRSRESIDGTLASVIRCGRALRNKQKNGYTQVYLPSSVTNFTPASRSDGRMSPSVAFARLDWIDAGTKPSRSLATVVLADGVASGIERDVGDFLLSERWYTERGLPYRRGYILHGEPGNGKTSLVFALAGRFQMPVYVLPLAANIDDEGFHRLLSTTTRRSIVLFEDVDAPGSAPVFIAQQKTTPADDTRPGSSLSVAGMLSITDGINAPLDGRLLFITCRSKAALRDDLTRPGRFDVSIPFTAPGPEQIKRLFMNFYEDACDDAAKLAVLADRFIRVARPSSKSSTLSMAAIQSILVRYKSSPEAAVASVALSSAA